MNKKVWEPIWNRVIYGSVWVLPTTGYSVHGFGYGVGKSDLQVTCIKPYTQIVLDDTVYTTCLGHYIDFHNLQQTQLHFLKFWVDRKFLIHARMPFQIFNYFNYEN